MGKERTQLYEEKKSLFFPLIKHSLKELMIIAKKRRMGKKKANHTFLILTKQPKNAFSVFTA